MKTKLFFSNTISALALCVFLVGCSTSVNISKKRYSNGYYVSVSKNQDVTKQNSATSKNNNNILDLTSKGINGQQNELDLATLNLNNEAATLKTLSVAKSQKAVANDAVVVSGSKREVLKAAKKVSKLIKKDASTRGADVDIVLLYILCFFIPFLAVGLVTDWDLSPVLINVLLCLLCGIPGIIHALIVVSKNA